MNEHQLSKVINWCNINKIKCLYFLCESSNPRSNYLAVENQFYPVNIRLTLSIDNIIDNVNTYNTNACVIRPSKDSDIPTLKKIASISYADTRFYYDPNFSNVLCDMLYKRWIENSCKGYAEMVLVAKLKKDVIGYISCHLDKAKTGRIGLIAVHPDGQGSGIGTNLIMSSLEWFHKNNTKKVVVATQGTNIISQRLYQKCGFRTYSTMLWYHKWFNYK